jgi:hypothetical protein
VDANLIDYLGHELGHVFGLADEYVLSDDVWLGGEPAQVNATVAKTMATLDPLWAAKITQTPIPTQLNTGCKNQNRVVNQNFPSGTIGLFEGACEHGCGVFRPAATCKMASNKSDPYCAVCADAIREQLRAHQ